jgi:hypothetical protein
MSLPGPLGRRFGSLGLGLSIELAPQCHVHPAMVEAQAAGCFVQPEKIGRLRLPHRSIVPIQGPMDMPLGGYVRCTDLEDAN